MIDIYEREAPINDFKTSGIEIQTPKLINQNEPPKTPTYLSYTADMFELMERWDSTISY